MSFISEQIAEIREFADYYFESASADMLTKCLLEAADTIETLSAKLQSANMERSIAYYNNGWIPVEERLPELESTVIVTTNTGFVCETYYGFTSDYDKEPCFHEWDSEMWQCYKQDVIAWMPLPEPYKNR